MYASLGRFGIHLKAEVSAFEQTSTRVWEGVLARSVDAPSQLRVSQRDHSKDPTKLGSFGLCGPGSGFNQGLKRLREKSKQDLIPPGSGTADSMEGASWGTHDLWGLVRRG